MKERRKLEQIFKTYEILPVTEEDSWQAMRILKAYNHSLGTGILDALIAATAIREGLVLCTSNDRHFIGIIGLKVERPFSA